jgi:exodeoxyribonuclease V alpha subunit
LFRFLCQLEQVGPIRARKIMKRFGDDVLDVITNEPERLLEIKGITADRISTIQMMYEKMREEQDVLLFLQSLKLSTKQIGKLMHAYGPSVRKIIEENPFLLVGGEVSVSFRMADEIRERVGLPEDSPLRIRAGCQHVVKNVQGQGHAYLAYAEFVGDVSRLLDLTAQQVEDELPTMKRKSLLFIEKDRVYGPLLYWAEHEVARAVKRLKEEV